MLPEIALLPPTREDVQRLVQWLDDNEVNSLWYGRGEDGLPLHIGYSPHRVLQASEADLQRVFDDEDRKIFAIPHQPRRTYRRRTVGSRVAAARGPAIHPHRPKRPCGTSTMGPWPSFISWTRPMNLMSCTGFGRMSPSIMSTLCRCSVTWDS